MSKWEWTKLALDLLISYGPTLLRIAIKIYKQVEDLAERMDWTGEEKGKRWNRQMRQQWKQRIGADPPTSELIALREGVWELMNPKRVTTYGRVNA